MTDLTTLIARLENATEPVAWLVKIYGNDKVLLDTRIDFVKPVISSTCITEFLPLYLYPPAPAASVKALEWDGMECRSSLGDLYSINQLSENVWAVYKNGTMFKGWYTGEEGAKAAAQADYENRIRSALVSFIGTSIDNPIEPPKNEHWKQYAGYFNSMTDKEIQTEVNHSRDIVDEHEDWLEAVASWEMAGKPRNTETKNS